MAHDNAPPEVPMPSNFLRGIIERDLEAGTFAQRRFGGSPGDAAHHRAGAPDPAPSLPCTGTGAGGAGGAAGTGSGGMGGGAAGGSVGSGAAQRGSGIDSNSSGTAIDRDCFFAIGSG